MNVETFLNSSVKDILKIIADSGNDSLEAVISGPGRLPIKIIVSYEEVVDDQ